MVDPVDLQNVLGRTPLVEKTVAAQREDLQQLQNQDAHLQRLRAHADERVEWKRDNTRVEPKSAQSGNQGAPEDNRDGQGSAGPEQPEVELVSESPEEPEHRLDVTL